MQLEDPVVLSAFVAYCSSRKRRVFLRGTVRDYSTSFPSLFRDPANQDGQCSPEQCGRRWSAYRAVAEELACRLKPSGPRSRWRRENIGAVLQHYGIRTPWLDVSPMSGRGTPLHRRLAADGASPDTPSTLRTAARGAAHRRWRRSSTGWDCERLQLVTADLAASNVGCIPTKALVASARAAHVARCADEFGVVIGGNVSVDMTKVKARKDAIVRRSREGVEKWLRALGNTTVYTGHARFEGPRTIRVGERILDADRIFINVGARAHVPSIPGLDRVRYRTNSSMMAVDFLPDHLVIVGGGYIGLEFAQIYRRFGSSVTLIHRGDRLLPRESADVSSAVKGDSRIGRRRGPRQRRMPACRHAR